MKNFTFSNPTKILFGTDAEKHAGEEVKIYASKVLLCYGSGSVVASGLLDRVRSSLREQGIESVELSGIQPNPRLSLVKQGIAVCREKGIDFILAVGGGSVIDTAKAIAVGVPYSGDVWDFYEYTATPTEALGVGVVLTIPAAGSESSNSTVISNMDLQLKRGLTTELVRPRFALMNPVLTFTLPPYQTACGAADIMAHIMERYFTNVRSVDFTDQLCEAGLRVIINNIPRVLANPEDYDARAEIMWTGAVAHNNLFDTGREGDWASHGIEHEISAIYDVAHGAGLAVVFPAWMRHVWRHDVARFAQFATRVWGVEMDYFNPERTALEGINRLEAFFQSIGLPVRLSQMNVPSDRIDEMASKATVKGGGAIGNFVKLDSDAIAAILNSAI